MTSPAGSYASLTISGTGYTITGSSGISAALSGTIDASQTSGSSTLNLPVNFVGTTAGTVTVNNAAATLTMGGAISGSAGLTTSGSGVLDLTATNTYTGGTTVSAGTTLVNGSVLGTVALSTGATLGGVGTVGSITSTAATVSPGDSSTKTGILTDSGALTLDTNSSFDVTLNGTTAGTNYDQLSRRRGDHPGRCDAQYLDRLLRPGRGRHVHDHPQHQRLGDHRHVRQT